MLSAPTISHHLIKLQLSLDHSETYYPNTAMKEVVLAIYGNPRPLNTLVAEHKDLVSFHRAPLQ